MYKSVRRSTRTGTLRACASTRARGWRGWSGDRLDELRKRWLDGEGTGSCAEFMGLTPAEFDAWMRS